ncbi:hypothetical protein [Streptomyces sp. 3N207]|uniref:hypothetical protein n=1 Tax=Streptomyces sp. 3N207 TaxID=3457417 RepID=UPI003FD29650
MNTERTRRALTLALLTPLLLLLPGCFGGRDYAVPRKICGVKMPKDAVEPLLPDGDKLHQSLRPIDESLTDCTASVAGNLSFVDVEIVTLDKPLTADDKRVSLTALKHARSVNVPGTHWAVQGDSGIHLSTPCGGSYTDSLAFRFSFGQDRKGAEVTRRNTLRFAEAFVDGQKKEEGCTAN